MTFSYNPSLPNPPNDPADDVPGMQTNTGSVSSLVAVDHVGFNISGGGQHKQVTFSSNNVPSPPVSPPILFTNNPGGAPLNYPQLFFYSGNSAQSSSQYVIAGSGSTFIFGGLILKWGSATITGGPSAVTFASAFPNNCYTVIAQPVNAGAPTVANDYVYVSSPSTAGFNATATRRITLASNTVTFYYIAIGN
jgi:hypothetical protein